MTVLFYLGLRTTDLPTAATIIFTSPIFVTALSVPPLGEKAGIRRIVGVLVGFLGALIVVRPGIVPLTTGMLCLLASAVVNALYQISTRHLRHGDKPMIPLYGARGRARPFRRRPVRLAGARRPGLDAARRLRLHRRHRPAPPHPKPSTSPPSAN